MKTWIIAASMCVLPMVAAAQTPAARDIQVSLSHVDSGLTCTEVGARTRISFDASGLAFKPRHVAVLLNGVPAAVDRVHEAWPRVTLDGGLAVGRNTVELIARRADGSTVRRSIVVKVGGSVRSDDGVTLGCSGPENQPTDVAASNLVTETSTAITYGPPPVVYAPAPVYYGYGGWYGPGWPGYWGSYWGPSLSIGVGTYWGGGHWYGRHGYRGWRGGHWRHY